MKTVVDSMVAMLCGLVVITLYNYQSCLFVCGFVAVFVGLLLR